MGDLIFAEEKQFAKWVRKQRLRNELESLKESLTQDRTLGDVIPGGSGIRKIRISGQGRGKSGGFRVIYVLVIEQQVAVFLQGYSKSEKEDLTREELAILVAMLPRVELTAKQLITSTDFDENQGVL